MKSIKRLVGLAVLLITLASVSTAKVFAQETVFERIYGKDRIETSIKIASKYKENTKLDAVILTSAYNFPDSLSASILSSKYHAPILLVGTDDLGSKQAIKFIKKNVSKSATIYALGGSGVVSNSTLTVLKKEGFKNHVRLSGKDRYFTNLEVVKYLNVKKGTPIIIANGNSFPDALSMSPISAINNYPIILTDNNFIKTETLSKIAEIKPSTIYIAGGVGAVSLDIENKLQHILPESNIERFAGKNRYETSKLIVNKFSKLFGANAIVASGENFPDALAGSSLAKKYIAPILLSTNDISNYSYFIKNNSVNHITVLGGESVVSNSIKQPFETIDINKSNNNSGAGVNVKNKRPNTNNTLSEKLINTDFNASNINYSIENVNRIDDVIKLNVKTSTTDQAKLYKLSFIIASFINKYNDHIYEVQINYNNGAYIFNTSNI